uniref:Flagellar FliJ protein n=1 Tax=Schlesneria paludicola TaxID=360056 RepID=A0A7C4LK87_9PLAN
MTFRLAALQRYREHLRDVLRQQLADLLSRDAALTRQRDDCLERRAEMLRQMRDLQQRPTLEIDAAALRRYHASQLTAEARRLEVERQQLAGLIAACRQRLILADQGVKVLEKLADRQREEIERSREHKEAREREEAWQAGQFASLPRRETH